MTADAGPGQTKAASCRSEQLVAVPAGRGLRDRLVANPSESTGTTPPRRETRPRPQQPGPRRCATVTGPRPARPGAAGASAQCFCWLAAQSPPPVRSPACVVSMSMPWPPTLLSADTAADVAAGGSSKRASPGVLGGSPPQVAWRLTASPPAGSRRRRSPSAAAASRACRDPRTCLRTGRWSAPACRPHPASASSR